MEELEHEIEAAAVAEEPEQAEDELAGEPEEENTGKHPMIAWDLLLHSTKQACMDAFALIRTTSQSLPLSSLAASLALELCAPVVGQWSPRPLDAEHVAGQDVITEEEDVLLLELQRAQIKYRAARQYAHAARQAAGHTDGAAFQDRAYQVPGLLSLWDLCRTAAAVPLVAPNYISHVSSACTMYEHNGWG